MLCYVSSHLTLPTFSATEVQAFKILHSTLSHLHRCRDEGEISDATRHTTRSPPHLLSDDFLLPITVTRVLLARELGLFHTAMIEYIQ